MKIKIGTKIICIAAIFGIAISNIALCDFNQENWQYFKDVKINNSFPNQLVKINLDQEIFNNAENDLRDIRIISDDGKETAYKLVIEKGVFNQNNIYPIRIINNSFVFGKHNLFIVDFGQSGFLNSSLKIAVSSKNFKRRVEISGSDNMRNWNVLENDIHIYDFTDRQINFKSQNTEINYPENAYRYLQIKIFSEENNPLKITGAQVSKITRSIAKETVLMPKYEIIQNTGRKTTEIIIDLEKKGWPTSSILLNSNLLNENFNREAVIYQSSDKNNWQKLGEDNIFNYNTDKFKGSDLNLNYSESDSRYLKIEIYNGDDSPINISGVSIKAILRSIMFQSTAGKNYRLYYGNEKARFPQYDLEKYFQYLYANNSFVAALSNEQNNPEFKKEISAKKPLSERIPYLLHFILVLSVFMLGFFVFRFMKDVKLKK